MFESLFKGVFDASSDTVISFGDFILCLGFSILTGLILAFAYMYKSRYTKSFAVTLAIIPATVCTVIMLVNGNIGTGVAVAGAFSLVRFRSAPGSAKEIGAIFIAMGAGLACGMGYLAYSLLFSLILGILTVAYNILPFGVKKKSEEKILRITVPETLDYDGVFEDILKKYTSYYQVTSVKTTNMGSLFRLAYNIVLRDTTLEKKFIDELRCRNGNLEISVSMRENEAACEL